MREIRTSGTVRGALSNRRSYRESMPRTDYKNSLIYPTLNLYASLRVFNYEITR